MYVCMRKTEREGGGGGTAKEGKRKGEKEGDGRKKSPGV